MTFSLPISNCDVKTTSTIVETTFQEAGLGGSRSPSTLGHSIKGECAKALHWHGVEQFARLALWRDRRSRPAKERSYQSQQYPGNVHLRSFVCLGVLWRVFKTKKLWPIVSSTVCPHEAPTIRPLSSRSDTHVQ